MIRWDVVCKKRLHVFRYRQRDFPVPIDFTMITIYVRMYDNVREMNGVGGFHVLTSVRIRFQLVINYNLKYGQKTQSSEHLMFVCVITNHGTLYCYGFPQEVVFVETVPYVSKTCIKLYRTFLKKRQDLPHGSFSMNKSITWVVFLL